MGVQKYNLYTVNNKILSLQKKKQKNSTFKKLISWHQVSSPMANRWRNNENSDKLLSSLAPKSLR